MIKTLVLLSFVGLSSARWYNGYHLVADEEVPLQDSTSDFEVDEELATKLQDDEQSLDDDAYSEPEEECDYTLMRGGFGELKYVTDEQQHFFDYKLFGLSSVANDLGPLKALSYRVQTVAGKNILFKVSSLASLYS